MKERLGRVTSRQQGRALPVFLGAKALKISFGGSGGFCFWYTIKKEATLICGGWVNE
jgi:hypothetical protein